MSNNYFQFKQFTVWQYNSALKVGTDGVLLGSWIDSKNAQNILDIGTGTGLLALMVAQKCNAEIDAVEINPEACKDATYNFSQSQWNKRIQLIESDFFSFIKGSSKQYDCIISNPPYFKNALLSPSNSKNIARHTNSLPHEKLLKGVATILSNNGLFYIILPSDISKAFISTARLSGLHPNNILRVFSKETDLLPIRSLICLSRNDCKAKESDLIIYQQDGYTEAYKALTRDYYLAF